MALINEHFLKLQNNYLFSDIAKKVNSFKVTHPKDKIIRMVLVTLRNHLPPPLSRRCIKPWKKWRARIHSTDMAPSRDILS